jgi:hypothetical protein
MEKTFVSCFYHELFNLLGHLAYKTGRFFTCKESKDAIYCERFNMYKFDKDELFLTFTDHMIKNECFMNMLLRLFKSFDKLEYYSDKATKLDVGQELYNEEEIKKILLANGSIKVSKRKIMNSSEIFELYVSEFLEK